MERDVFDAGILAVLQVEIARVAASGTQREQIALFYTKAAVLHTECAIADGSENGGIPRIHL